MKFKPNKLKKEILFLVVLIILFVFLILISLRNNKKNNADGIKEQEETPVSYEFQKYDPNRYTDFIPFSDNELKLKLYYPRNWEVTKQDNCSIDHNPFSHICITVSKNNYELFIYVFKEFPEGKGVLIEKDLVSAERFDVDGVKLLRPKYINSSGIIPKYLVVIEFITDFNSQPKGNSYGKVSNEYEINNKQFTISYAAPEEAIKSNDELNNSSYIKTMDLILQSIDWDTN